MTFKAFLICFMVAAFLLLVRSMLTGTLDYIFILWNILLAAAPLWVESLMYAANRKWKGWQSGMTRFMLGGAWLMVLPNAFYILTDFMHQNSSVVVNDRHDGYFGGIRYTRGDAVYIYDSLLILAATMLGAYFGGLALLHAYVFFKKHGSKIIAYGLVGGVMVLSGIGVYIGRYGRWNSWDVLYRPWSIVSDFILQLASPVLRERLFVTVLTIVLFQIFALYGVAWTQGKRPAKW